MVESKLDVDVDFKNRERHRYGERCPQMKMDAVTRYSMKVFDLY